MEFLSLESLIALVSLTSLEIVLGIDNIVFIAILTNRLPPGDQSRIRRIGLALAMLMRIALLFTISWVVSLKDPFFSVFSHDVSGRDLIMLGGGLFLLGKATFEIHGTLEGEAHADSTTSAKFATVPAVLVQIMLIDIVFSLDSVITAVGMVGSIPIMVTAVVISVVIMMIFADSVSAFIMRHPTVKMLALSFLMLIGFVLVADGFGKHIEKGYIYFAIAFSVVVEALNLRLRKSRLKA